MATDDEPKAGGDTFGLAAQPLEMRQDGAVLRGSEQSARLDERLQTGEDGRPSLGDRRKISLQVSKPPWTRASLTTPFPTSSISRDTLESGSALDFAAVHLVHADLGGPFGCDAVPPVDEPVGGIGLEDHLIGVADDEADVLVQQVPGGAFSSLNERSWGRPSGVASRGSCRQDR
jgi:hypothetical protein